MNKIRATAFALSAMTLQLVAMPAIAADLQVRPPAKAPVYKAAPISAAYNWNGWYVGGHVGYLWRETSVWDEGVLIEHNARTDGVVGGLLSGFNWQNGALVLGLEGDFGWTNAHGTGFGVSLPLPANRYDFNWTSHIRGRIGYAANNWLFFVAGGLALADFDYRQATSTIPEGAVYTGWTIGGGIDFAFAPKWIGRVEYLHDDFGSKNYLISGDPYRVKLTGDTVRGALMYKF